VVPLTLLAVALHLQPMRFLLKQDALIFLLL
jgi:hypothetical protein